MAFFPTFSTEKKLKVSNETNPKKYVNKLSSFIYHHTVSIGDTNITRSVYFTRYLEWLGYAREAMLINTVNPSEIVSGEIILVTKNTAIAYLKEFDLYDKVELHVTTGKLTASTVQLCFRYIHAEKQELYAVAKQLILMTSKQGKPKKAPLKYVNVVLKYPEKNMSEIDSHLKKRML
ncbi:MAG: acyl-CoA thioesterase [Candidatus Electrothrix aestuarii]|uniref:Acyl-CoA thioesterase n=1 Tax=Candidatus Electrothrix aestuarii TaxID=3062594 RepID=A0AAU8M059_9BACT|nr:acyl-CoA thioesterase [Candidatus Electrothrix aestuarii]